MKRCKAHSCNLCTYPRHCVYTAYRYDHAEGDITSSELCRDISNIPRMYLYFIPSLLSYPRAVQGLGSITVPCREGLSKTCTGHTKLQSYTVARIYHVLYTFTGNYGRRCKRFFGSIFRNISMFSDCVEFDNDEPL